MTSIVVDVVKLITMRINGPELQLVNLEVGMVKDEF